MVITLVTKNLLFETELSFIMTLLKSITDCFRYLLALLMLTITFPAFAQNKGIRDCEDTIRGVMLKPGMLRFVDMPTSKVDDEFEFYNDWSKFDKIDYSYTQQNSNVTEISVTYKNEKASIEYKLSSVDSSNIIFELSIGYSGPSLTSNGVGVSINQKININKDCKFKIKSAEKEEVSKLDVGLKKVSLSESMYDGSDNFDTKILKTPDGSDFLDNDPQYLNIIGSILNFSLNGYIQMWSELVHIQVLSLPSMNLGFFSKNATDIRAVHIKMTSGGSSYNTFTILDVKSRRGFLFSKEFNKIEFLVDEKNWALQRLGSAFVYAGISIFLKEDDFNSKAPLKIILNTNFPLEYNNMGAYWTQERVVSDSKGIKSIIFTEASAEIRGAVATSKELENSEILQYDSLEVQSLVKTILLKNPKTREEKVNLILQKINSLLTYDFEMFENDQVRPLKSIDILKRGKGVCQHYALLFVALARAMNVPATVVVGFYLEEGKFTAHAWVEYEKEPGLWIAIDPQYTNSKIVRTNRYFPLIRATSIENGNAFLSQLKSYLLKLEVRKAP